MRIFNFKSLVDHIHIKLYFMLSIYWNQMNLLLGFSCLTGVMLFGKKTNIIKDKYEVLKSFSRKVFVEVFYVNYCSINVSYYHNCESWCIKLIGLYDCLSSKKRELFMFSLMKILDYDSFHNIKNSK